MRVFAFEPPSRRTLTPVEVLTTPDEMRAWSSARHCAGATIGFVPTMGALHGGHLRLIDAAGQRCDHVVVSIFVNPLQFNESADFDSYPRPIDDDVDACRRRGVSAVYAPTGASMYPPGFQTRVVPGALADTMEGPGRPGHFEGVVTVVTKLFGAVRPDLAVFGQKDFQQLQIIRRMTRDLDLGVEILGHPIVRDPDGLAQSSRNLRLSPEQRAAAVVVPRSLQEAADIARSGGTVDQVRTAAIATIADEPLAGVEYVTVFDADTLLELDDIDATPPDRVRIATAVWFGDVRLIDNRDLFTA